MPNTEIIPYQALSAIVAGHDMAVRDVEEAFRLLAQAKKTLSDTLGKYKDSILHGGQIYDLDLEDVDDNIARSKVIIKRSAWDYILQQTEVLNIISSKKRKELTDQMESGDMPDVTVENIQETLLSLRMNMKGLMSESIKEAFEFLRPRRETHKTNSKYEIGKKVILTYFVEPYGGGLSLIYTRQDDLQCIDNAFHLMDGKGPAKYPNTLATIVDDAMKKKVSRCETPYFKCKWFKAGTFHVEFKRTDLLRELNRIGGGNRLKPENFNLS